MWGVKSLISKSSTSNGVPTIRLWKIEKGNLAEIKKSKLDFEERLEEWIATNISIISSNWLVIGRQVTTSYGGVIDLLCMKENGDLVIIELKRDKTPRDITAQVLDYASWIKTLTLEKVQEIAKDYLKLDIEEAYYSKFHQDFPEIINQEHEMYVVGSEIDSSSQRIIDYLSETYGAAINAITFNYFTENGYEYLARTFLIEPSKAEMAQIARPKKRITYLTEDQLNQIAKENEVGELYQFLVTKLNPLFDSKGTTRSSIAFSGLQEGKMNTIFHLVPEESNSESGVKFRFYSRRFADYFNISEEQLVSKLPTNREDWRPYRNYPEYFGFEGFFQNKDEVERFIHGLEKPKSS